MLLKFLLISASFMLAQGIEIRFNNTGNEDIIYIVEAEGHPPNNGTVIEAGNFTEIVTANDLVGSFYAYPAECLVNGINSCYYPVTKVRVEFQRYIFGGFYDFLMIDLNRGFNYRASISPLMNRKCQKLVCDAYILETCPGDDQVLNADGKLVACRTSAGNYLQFKEQCPDALVDGDDLNVRVCSDFRYEITFANGI